MAGTLTNLTGATSFRFHNTSRLTSPSISTESPSNAYIRNRNVPKASMHTVIDEPTMKLKTKPMSLYDVLNVNRNATLSEIKSAYRSLAKRYHPDLKQNNDNDDEDDRDFVEICNAYVTLIDPTARALYDVKLSGGFGRRLGGVYGGGGAGNRSGFYGGRRWETDQCW
ncbi:hypothetical protein QVD17_38530 [Tagetes erecta]|uniref:J domain-containing protein n=1 Tax=Tagetes erecta TaxID=13708 RepID=A0AAD8NGB6_TARER|nr:hypothetical protein QVD17_38530 [Tagetes erecta]